MFNVSLMCHCVVVMKDSNKAYIASKIIYELFL